MASKLNSPVPADPWSAGIMAAGSVASAALTPPPMNAQQTTGAVTFDNSGWAVNVGAGASQSTSTDRSMSALGASRMLRNPVVLLAILAGLYYLSKHK
jgi:hypothetical protein